MDFSYLKNLNVKYTPNASLCDYTTFQLGGATPCLIECETPVQIENVIHSLIERNIEHILIGGGANLLVSDRGIDSVVIRYVSPSPLINRDENILNVSGSTKLDDLGRFAQQNALEGLNFVTGIPGTVGGAIVGNAGAFGKQVGDVLDSVTLLTQDGIKKKVFSASLGFRYRYSNLKENKDIILSAKFVLKSGNSGELLKERQDILDLRRSRHPDISLIPSAGSFFRNIEPTSSAQKRQAAGWFLEQSGVKNLSVGGARIFEKHANIIVKSDGCTAENVFDLSQLMSKAVKEKFDLCLIREVQLVGFFS